MPNSSAARVAELRMTIFLLEILQQLRRAVHPRYVDGALAVEARPSDEHVVADCDELRHVDGLRRRAMRDDSQFTERAVGRNGAQREIGAAAGRGAPPAHDGRAVGDEQQADLAERARAVEVD